jgi:hypothetical protein
MDDFLWLPIPFGKTGKNQLAFVIKITVFTSPSLKTPFKIIETQ